MSYAENRRLSETENDRANQQSAAVTSWCALDLDLAGRFPAAQGIHRYTQYPGCFTDSYSHAMIICRTPEKSSYKQSTAFSYHHCDGLWVSFQDRPKQTRDSLPLSAQ